MSDRQAVLWAAYDSGRAFGAPPVATDSGSTDLEVIQYFFNGYWDLHSPRDANPKRVSDWSQRKVFANV